MSFVDDVNNLTDPLVGGSGDFPQRMLNEGMGGGQLAFAPTPSPSYRNMAQQPAPSPISEIKEEQENLSDRLDKLESEAPKKSKSVKQWAKKNRKKIKVALLVGVALYAGYHLFLKGKLKFGQGGQAPDPMPPAPAPAPQMETGGEIDSGDI